MTTSMEVVLKTSMVNFQMQELEKTVREAREVMREAAAELQRLNAENDKLRDENNLLNTRLRIVELRNVKRAEFGKLPLLRTAE